MRDDASIGQALDVRKVCAVMSDTDDELYHRLIKLRESFPPCEISGPVLINSVPKCGTMLLRNILFMFWPEPDWYLPFVEPANLAEILTLSMQSSILCTGHLDYSPVSLAHTRFCKKLILVRHPGQYALSYARFLFSEQFQQRSAIAHLVASHQMSMSEAVRLVLTGMHYGQEVLPNVLDQFTWKAVAWMDTDTLLIRYEELLRAATIPENAASAQYFRSLFAYLGTDLPNDWIARVKAGADRFVSSTSPVNQRHIAVLDSRSRLETSEAALLQALAPGLALALGYCEVGTGARRGNKVRNWFATALAR